LTRIKDVPPAEEEYRVRPNSSAGGTMSDHAISTTVTTAEPPRVFDTYALVYAFSLTFLIPGLVAMSGMPFRTYTFQYVAAVAVPFLLGILATFFTDSTDSIRRVALRSAILVPLVLMTGVTVLFIGMMSLLPISKFLKPGVNNNVTAPITVALLALLVSPLLVAVWRRVRTRLTWRSAVQLAALVIAIVVAAWVGHLMLSTPGELRGFARKDLTIYLTGAVMWYLPSFGIAAGGWRAVGMV
jgi:hypothetical protein